MLLMGRNVDAIPRQQLHDPVLELELGGPGENQDPLVLWLVTPEAFRRPVPGADDSFDPDAGALLQKLNIK